MFKVNEGPVDRGIRVVLGIALLLVALVGVGVSSTLGVVLLVAGAALTITGAVGFCGLYKVLGINTCPAPRQDQ
jgi:hypothetical protein